jgi:hypothetical protein
MPDGGLGRYLKMEIAGREAPPQSSLSQLLGGESKKEEPLRQSLVRFPARDFRAVRVLSVGETPSSVKLAHSRFR